MCDFSEDIYNIFKKINTLHLILSHINNFENITRQMINGRYNKKEYDYDEYLIYKIDKFNIDYIKSMFNVLNESLKKKNINLNYIPIQKISENNSSILIFLKYNDNIIHTQDIINTIEKLFPKILSQKNMVNHNIIKHKRKREDNTKINNKELLEELNKIKKFKNDFKEKIDNLEERVNNLYDLLNKYNSELFKNNESNDTN